MSMIIHIQISFICHNNTIKVINYATIYLLAYELQITSYNRYYLYHIYNYVLFITNSLLASLTFDRIIYCGKYLLVYYYVYTHAHIYIRTMCVEYTQIYIYIYIYI